jgi:hypothetical protein
MRVMGAFVWHACMQILFAPQHKPTLSLVLVVAMVMVMVMVAVDK